MSVLHTPATIIYFIADYEGGAVKIGITSASANEPVERGVGRRIGAMQCHNPRLLTFVRAYFGSPIHEKQMQAKCTARGLKIRGEWFRLEALDVPPVRGMRLAWDITRGARPQPVIPVG